MHGLVQNIINSYETRSNTVTQIRHAVEQGRKDARAQLGELDRSHKIMAQELRANLAEGRAELAKDEAERRSEVDRWLERVATSRQEKGKELRANLAEGRAELTKDDAKRRSEVDRWLKRVATSRQEKGKKLRANLAKGRAELTKDDAKRRSEVDRWLKGVAATRARAQEEWQGMGAALRAKRAGAAVAETTLGGEEEEAVAKAEVGEVTGELLAMSTKVFQYLAEHPDGTRLVELEQEFKVSRFQMARVVKKLMTEGKTEKRGFLYYAI